VNASLTGTEEIYEKFAEDGIGNLPNGISRARIAGYNERDENVATLIFSCECFNRENSYSGNSF
jgi:hypothetical protein